MNRCVFAWSMALALAACSVALDFNQCAIDSDCARFSTQGSAVYCTADHICVNDVPSDRICRPAKTTAPVAHNAVTVAGLFRVTSPDNVIDVNLVNAVTLGVDEVNQAGKRSIRFIVCDTAGDPNQARKALTVAAENFGAVAAVGPTSSNELIAITQEGDNLVEKYGILVVSPSATSPVIASIADNNLVWRTAANDTLQSQVLASLVAEMTPVPTKIADAFVDSSYGHGLSDAFINALRIELAMNPIVPTAKAFAQGTGGADVEQFLQGLSPQTALIVADSDAPNWIAALNNGGAALANTQFLLTDGSKTPELFAQNPSPLVLKRVQGTAPATPSGAAFDTFQANYMGRFGVDPAGTAFVANSYDALYAIAIAMGKVPVAERVTGYELVLGMGQLSDQDGFPITVGNNDFATAYQRLADGGTVNLEGTSGPVDFDPSTGDILSAPIEVWNVDVTGATPVFHTLRIVTP